MERTSFAHLSFDDIRMLSSRKREEAILQEPSPVFLKLNIARLLTAYRWDENEVFKIAGEFVEEERGVLIVPVESILEKVKELIPEAFEETEA